MSKTSKVVEVPERLRRMADLFEERNRAYGNNFVTMGPVLHAMFPQGVRVETPDEWQRIFTIVMAAMKITRYAQNLRRGGHQDSLDDMSVYMQMGAYTDDLARHQTEMAVARETLSSVVVPPAEQDPSKEGHTLVETHRTFSQALVRVGEIGVAVRRYGWGTEDKIRFYHVPESMYLATAEDRAATDWEIWYSDSSPAWPGRRAEAEMVWKLMSSGLSYVSTANMLGRSDTRARRSAWEAGVFIHSAGELILSSTDLSADDWEIWTCEPAPWRGTGGARSDGTA